MANYGYDKYVDRFITILTLINENKAIVIKNLAKDFGVSSKTIERSLQELLVSFPVIKLENEWRMCNGFRYCNKSDIEDAVLVYFIKKLLESAGTKFSNKSKMIFKIEKYDKYKKYLEKEYMFFLESAEGVKAYFDQVPLVLMNNANHDSFGLAAAGDGKYLVRDDRHKIPCMYNSEEDIISDGWRIIPKEEMIDYN